MKLYTRFVASWLISGKVMGPLHLGEAGALIWAEVRRFHTLVFVGGETLSIKRLKSLVAALGIVLTALSTAHAVDLNWDINNTTPEASDTTVADGTWSTVDLNWNDAADGGAGTIQAWTSGSIAHFSAGTTTTSATVTLDSANNVSVGGIFFEEGATTLGGGVGSGDQLTLTAPTIDVATGSTGAINSVIGGAVGLTKANSGTLTIGSANTYTGTTTISGGTLQLGGTGVIPDASRISFATGTTFDMNNNSESVGSLTSASAGGTILLTGDLTVGNDNTTTGNYSGILQGGFDFHKVGTGTQVLSGDSGTPTAAGGMDGRFFVDSGTLNVTFANTASVSSKNPLGAALVTVADGATLQVSGATGYAGGVAGTAGAIPLQNITIQGTGAGGTGALRKTGNNATNLGGSIKLAGADGTNVRIQSENTSSTFTLSGNLSPVSAGTNHNLTVSQATGGATTISGTMGLGTGTLTKEGGGTLTLSGNNIGTWSGKIFVNGGVLAWSSDNSFTNHLGAGPTSPVSDYVTVNGGTLRMTTGDTTGTSFMRSNRGIVLGPNGGTIDMSSTTVAAKAIYGQGVAGSGTIGLTTGTTAATLTKTGQGEFRWNGPGTQTAGFTKLVLNRGLYRLGSVTGSNFETGLGAVPVTSTPDAVEFTGTAANPAYFASSFNMTSTLAWNVNRGVKFTGEGTFLGSGGVEINILGPISGSGKLIAGSATSPYNTTGAFSSGTVRLSNVNNASTFTGSVAVNNGTLILNQSLNATNFSGTDTIGDGSGTSTGDLNVNGSSVVFTAGSDNTNSSYAGRVIGTGTFTKVGTGTLTLNTVGANSWTNTAGVKINAGSLKYGSAASGLLDTVPVTIDGTSAVAGQSGTLDLTTAGVTGDTIGSLISTSGNTFGQILQGNANLTLGATAATARTYRGSIISTGGTFTKAGGTFTQNLEQGAVNNTLGAVNVNLGRLNFNGINTTGAVTVASTATLGGNGSVTGAVSVQSGGTLAPGTSLGTFGEGALSMVSGSTFQYELNSSGSPSADLLNINGDLSLGDTTFTGLDLATTSLAIPGTKFTVMSYAGNWDNSTFLGIANGGTVTIGANTFNVKYDDTSAGVNTGSLYSKFVTLAVPGAGCAPGDLNCDGHEDAGDYVFWRKNNSTPAGDYNIWRANFGTPPGSGSGSGLGSGAAVPEPSGIALLMVALAAMATRRRGR